MTEKVAGFSGDGERGRAAGEVMEHLWAPWRMAYVAAPKTEGCFLCHAANARTAEAEAAQLVLARRGEAFALMNRYPYNAGHVMVVPARHVAGLDALSPGEALDCWRLVVDTQKALTTICLPDGYNLGINQGKAGGAGLAEHLHIHVVPRWEGDHNFMTVMADARVVPEALAATAAKIREAFARLP